MSAFQDKHGLMEMYLYKIASRKSTDVQSADYPLTCNTKKKSDLVCQYQKFSKIGLILLRVSPFADVKLEMQWFRLNKALINQYFHALTPTQHKSAWRWSQVYNMDNTVNALYRLYPFKEIYIMCLMTFSPFSLLSLSKMIRCNLLSFYVN